MVLCEVIPLFVVGEGVKGRAGQVVVVNPCTNACDILTVCKTA